LQAYGIAVGLAGQGASSRSGLVLPHLDVITLTGGTMFLMWLGEQITARGIGNGISLIIFAGIVAELPAAIARCSSSAVPARCRPAVLAIIVILLAIAVIAFIVFIERAQRRLLIQYPKRQVGNKMSAGRSSLPAAEAQHRRRHPADLRLVAAAAAATVAGFSPGPRARSGCRLLHGACSATASRSTCSLYAALIVFFCFFYTSIVFNPTETADNLKKYGGFIPGIRPGKRTAEYIDYVLTRLTVIGAIYIAAGLSAAGIPDLAYAAVPFAFGGTSLLIVVSVTMDTVAQIQSHLLAHQYEGLIKKSKLRGGT
jgi:preprotein translocase subunit SecY